MNSNRRRPPLPAPTDVSSADNTSLVGAHEDLVTNLSLRTDKTHYTIPEDGTPVTITTKKHKDPKKQSSTSLLIEYFEGGKESKLSSSRPSLRVRVTPSASRKSKHGRDHIQISETNRSGSRSKVRRFSLPGRDTDQIELHSGSDVSSTHVPLDVEVLHAHSDDSEAGGESVMSRHVVPPSDISSMPPDSLMEAAKVAHAVKDNTMISAKSATKIDLAVPSRNDDHSASRERLAQRVMEKLQQDPGVRIHDGTRRRRRSGTSDRASLNAEELSTTTSKPRGSRSRDIIRESLSDASALSTQSAVSSSSITNPRLLTAVEDAIKKLILPELKAVKDEQRAMKARHKHDELSRSSTSSRKDGLRRSSVSSSPAGAEAPAVRDASIEDLVPRNEERSRRHSSRRSSQESVSQRHTDTTSKQHHGRRRSSGGRRASKDSLVNAKTAGVSAAALAGLATASLKHQSSHSTINENRTRRRSKSRSSSRSTTVSEHRKTREETLGSLRHDVPPLPLQSVLNSDMTRDSLVSCRTENDLSRRSATGTSLLHHVHTVNRYSPTLERVPLASGSHGPISSSMTISGNNGRLMDQHRNEKRQIVGTGLGAAAAAATKASLQYHKSRDHLSPSHESSPAQSDISSFRERPKQSSDSFHAQTNGIKRQTHLQHHNSSHLHNFSPSTEEIKQSRPMLSRNASYEIMPESDESLPSPQADELERWIAAEQRQHHNLTKRDINRGDEVDNGSTADAVVTEDESRVSPGRRVDKSVGLLGAKPAYIHTPAAVESAVASLQEPSSISVQSSDTSSVKRMGASSQIRGVTRIDEFISQGSRQRWEAVRDRAMAMTGRTDSPAQSESRSLEGQPLMGATYVPSGDMPEFGAIRDDMSDLITNPSILSGRMGDELEMSMYDDTYDLNTLVQHRQAKATADEVFRASTRPEAGLGLDFDAMQSSHPQGPLTHTPAALGREPAEEQAIASGSFKNVSLHHKDEGYISANPATSPAAQSAFRVAPVDYVDDVDMDDPFISQRHLKHESGLSHGMHSPLYDSATGRGVDRIESKDIVALMNHLTARDSQRNARDTEILYTLVHSAAEMRTNFEEMKKYIAHQDRLIMQNMDRAQITSARRAVNGAQSPLSNASRTETRFAADGDSETPLKRANVFRRALKGLSMRSTNDLTRIEDMLVQLLKEMEELKDSNIGLKGAASHIPTTSLSSYEYLRAIPDPGYEPSGGAGTDSSPTRSGALSVPSSRLRSTQQSNHEVNRYSADHRISTVLEGDEEADHDLDFQGHDYEGDFTPPKHVALHASTPPLQNDGYQSLEPTPKTDRSRGRYKSGSSLFGGIAKISRWSKTTASTIPDGNQATIRRKSRPASSDSKSAMYGDYEDVYDEEGPESGERQSPNMERTQASQVSARPASPLVPEQEQEHDDPKYQVHRNSQNLQHPQPRPGPTHRHQSHLEHQAVKFGQSRTPVADQWGSIPALALNRNRYSTGSQHQLSPVQSEDVDSLSTASNEHGETQHNMRAMDDEGPLIPSIISNSSTGTKYELYGVPLMSSGMHIASPLEPIEEVRKSLETDRSSIRPESTPSPHPVAMRSVHRRITGPREMPRSASSSSKRRQVAVPSESPGQ